MSEDEAILIRTPSSPSTIKHKLSLHQRLAYSVGHVFNDLCAAMWFSYLLVYMHYINHFHNKAAGVLLLIGQVADAIATPFVGYESDKNHEHWWLCKFGRRKTWHLFGTICVIISFPFIFNKCITCENADQYAQIIYYSSFIIIFQIGWASVQVAHLSLIPDLTPHSHERSELNAWRYAFTVASNITVYVITWIILNDPTNQSDYLNESDQYHFRIIVFITVGIGFVFSLIFHFGVREKSQNDLHDELNDEIDNIGFINKKHLKWKHWFKESQFYKVALLYMGTRLTVNLTQVYTPFYLQESLHMQKGSIAYIPLVMFCTGFISSFLMKYLNRFLGKKITYLLGSAISLGACTWLYFGNNSNFINYGIYVVSSLIGISGTIMLITSLAVTNDLIGHNTASGAFVFGSMSFLDKLSNGVAVIVIENLHPSKTCGCETCDNYYRNILSFVCGGATVLSLLALALLAHHKIGVTYSEEINSNSSIKRNDYTSDKNEKCNTQDSDINESDRSPLLINDAN